MRDTLDAIGKKLVTVFTTPGLTSFWNHDNYVTFLFSERTTALEEIDRLKTIYSGVNEPALNSVIQYN